MQDFNYKTCYSEKNKFYRNKSENLIYIHYLQCIKERWHRGANKYQKEYLIRCQMKIAVFTTYVIIYTSILRLRS